jgi:hypothetical protein
MGICGSHQVFELNEDILGFDEKSKEFYQSIGLSDEDLNILYTAFYDIDSDNSKVIRIDEFLTYFEISNSTLTTKLFSLFEPDAKYLSFLSFVTIIWYVCSIDSKRLPAVIYRLYDPTNLNAITIPQIVEFMKIVNADIQGSSSRIEKCVEALPGYGDRRTAITATQFSNWAESYQAIFSPVVTIQMNLRIKIMGVKIWHDREEKREKNKELNDFLVDITILKKVQQINKHHMTTIRQKELANRAAPKKEISRNRMTLLMVKNLNKSNEPVRAKKGEVSESTEDAVSAMPTVPMKTAPSENRRRRSVFKPSLAAEKPSSGKISPAISKERSRKN